MPARSRYVLTARLGLATPPLGIRKVAEPLGLRETRIRQLQLLAMESLVDAAMGFNSEFIIARPNGVMGTR